MVASAVSTNSKTASAALSRRHLSPKQMALLSVGDDGAVDDSITGSKKPPKLTPFQRSVYTALCQVPAGRVTTYKHLALAVDCGSSQAVGQALRRNPHAPVVPCHRVVASNRTLGGFGGQTAGPKLDKKRKLLEEEGVRFDSSSGKVEESCMYNISEKEVDET